MTHTVWVIPYESQRLWRSDSVIIFLLRYHYPIGNWVIIWVVFCCIFIILITIKHMKHFLKRFIWRPLLFCVGCLGVRRDLNECITLPLEINESSKIRRKSPHATTTLHTATLTEWFFWYVIIRTPLCNK